MEEKHKNLKSTKQQKIIEQVMATLSKSHPSFYYLSTIELAVEITDYMQQTGNLLKEDYDLIKDLNHRDIQIILSLHS